MSKRWLGDREPGFEPAIFELCSQKTQTGFWSTPSGTVAMPIAEGKERTMKPQVIRTESGEELVVLPRNTYNDLIARAGIDEDAGTARIVDRSTAALASGSEIALPAEIAEAIARGENPIRVVREWRGLTQAQLARRNRLTQSYISQLEAGSSSGSPKALKAIATTLKVPVDLLMAG